MGEMPSQYRHGSKLAELHNLRALYAFAQLAFCISQQGTWEFLCGDCAIWQPCVSVWVLPTTELNLVFVSNIDS